MSFPASKVFRVKPKKSSSGGNVPVPKLQLTSLVDIMTFLLVFLIMSYSAEGDIITMSKELLLPESSAEKKPKLAVMIIISKNELLVENKIVSSLMDIDQSSELIISGLQQYLIQRRNLTEEIARHSTTAEFKGEVLIQADRKIPYRILQKVMYTCGQNGYNDFFLLVLSKTG